MRAGGVALSLLVGGCTAQSELRAPESPEPAWTEAAGYAEPQRMPLPVAAGDTSDPVLSLRTPFARAEVTRLLDRYFEAISRESNADLSLVLTDDATLHFGLQQPGSSALVGWVRRFAQHDYATAHPEGLFDRRSLDVYTAADARVLAPRGELAFVPEADQLIARVRLTAGALSKRFGDEMQVVIAPLGDELRIRRIYERGFVVQ